MVRRRLTHQEEEALAKAAEEPASRGAWDLARAKPVNRGANPTVVLSGRVPVVYAQMLRRTAIERRCSISDLVKQALESFAASPGPRVSYAHPKLMMLRSAAPSGPETMNPTREPFITQAPTTETRATA